MASNIHPKWAFFRMTSMILVIFLTGMFAASTAQALEQTLPIQSVISTQFTADVVFEKSVAELSDEGQTLGYNTSILVVFEQDSVILGVMHLYGPSEFWSLAYLIGNLEDSVTLWSEGDPQIHFTFSNPSSIHFVFLEITSLIHVDNLHIRALAFYSSETQETIQTNIHTIYSTYNAEFCDSLPYGDSPPETTESTEPTETTDPSWFSTIPGFSIFALICVAFMSFRQLTHEIKKKMI